MYTDMQQGDPRVTYYLHIGKEEIRARKLYLKEHDIIKGIFVRLIQLRGKDKDRENMKGALNIEVIDIMKNCWVTIQTEN